MTGKIQRREGKGHIGVQMVEAQGNRRRTRAHAEPIGEQNVEIKDIGRECDGIIRNNLVDQEVMEGIAELGADYGREGGEVN